MTETEEMRNAFEWCSTMPGCKGCPLEYKYACRFRLMQWAYKRMSAQQKAIATLKQKLFYQLQKNEPRLLTLDEVKKYRDGDPLVIELNTGSAYWVLVNPSQFKSYDDYQYNKFYRYWTSRPTDEERKNTPWEGQNNE